MSISPFFRTLRSAYQAEIDDLTSDSEGRDVLRKRLAEKRKELGFLVQMMEISPEMVAVVFHQGFKFKLPAVMEQLLQSEPEDLPEWDTLGDAVQLQPWAEALTPVILKQPMGAWFLSVAAALEYMYGKPGAGGAASQDEAQDEDEDKDDDRDSAFGDEDADDARLREEAGADWMAEQGFDRKD